MSSPGTTNLEAWWELNEESGARADAHGANALTDNNTVLFNAAGIQGNAADFELSNDEYLNITDNASLSMGDIDFTVGAWCQMEAKAGATMVVLGKWTAQNDEREYQIYWSQPDDRFAFRVSSDGLDSTPELADELGGVSIATWYFILAWHDSVNNTINIQVNDGTVDSAAYAAGVFDGVAEFIVGAHKNALGAIRVEWDGEIDEGFAYKKILTSDERTWLYNTGSGRAYADLTAGAIMNQFQQAMLGADLFDGALL